MSKDAHALKEGGSTEGHAQSVAKTTRGWKAKRAFYGIFLSVLERPEIRQRCVRLTAGLF